MYYWQTDQESICEHFCDFLPSQGNLLHALQMLKWGNKRNEEKIAEKKNKRNNKKITS